ncbi:MAG: hypothetical protein U1F65_03245 [Verrucomicrobiota bacterium]
MNMPIASGNSWKTLTLPILAALALVALNQSQAQSVIIPPPAISPEVRPTESSSGTNEVESASGGSSSSTGFGSVPQNNNPFSWGPVVLHPRLAYGFSYGTGLQSQPGQARRTVINTLTPGITFDLGQLWALSYNAAATFYSDPNFKDNVDHNVSLRGHTTYEDWSFNLSQSAAITSDPLVETAQQTDQQSYSTSFGAGYQINGEWSGQLTAAQDLRYAKGVQNGSGSTADWSLSGGLNYQIGPGVSTGVGAGAGYNHVGTGTDMTYENLNGQISWHFARKLSLSVNGGAEIRQFLGSGQSSLISPTFGVGLDYHPLDYTAISLSASRGVSPSLFRNQVTQTTSVNLGLSQRLFGKYYLSVSGGYGLSTYQDSSLTGAAFSGREDTRSFFSVNLSRSFLKRGTASVSYSNSHNTSNATGFGYDSDQIGFSIAYSY